MTTLPRGSFNSFAPPAPASEILSTSTAPPVMIGVTVAGKRSGTPTFGSGNASSAVIRAGGLNGVGMIFGGHLDRHFPTGTVIVTVLPAAGGSSRMQGRDKLMEPIRGEPILRTAAKAANWDLRGRDLPRSQ